MMIYIFILILGLFIFYILIDLLIICQGNINNFFDKWLKKTLWIWLPFYAFWRLTKEVASRKK